MYVDFKCTLWERITVPDEYKEEFLIALKNGDIQEANDAYSQFGSIMDNNYELLLDTGEMMTPEDNGGFPTIEVHEDNGKPFEDEIIWDNGRNNGDK